MGSLNNYPVLSFSCSVCVRVLYVLHNIQILLRRQNSSCPCVCVYGTPHPSTGWRHTVRNLFSQHWHKIRKDRCCVLWMANKDTQKWRSEVFKNFRSWICGIKNLSFLNNVSLCICIHMSLLYMVRAYVNMYICIIQSTASIRRAAVIRVLNSSECSDIPNGTGKRRSHENNSHWARPLAPCWESTVNMGGKNSRELALSLYPAPTHPCQEFANFEKILVDLWLDRA